MRQDFTQHTKQRYFDLNNIIAFKGPFEQLDIGAYFYYEPN